MTTPLEKAMRATVEAFLYGFDGDWTPGMTLAERTEDCVQEMLPVSLGYPARTKQEWAEYFAGVAAGGFVKAAKMIINDFVSAPAGRRAVARSSMSAQTPVGRFNNEYVWFFTFNEDGTKIAHISEFLDSAATKQFRERKASYDAAHGSS